ncbi:MAG: hypothetical protein CBARDMAM_6651 [uncultured Caballeronia sp.]|nr:MAG: hypothetical protein CBARDMAM_6651 [uncultured Caballeronia sp.]
MKQGWLSKSASEKLSRQANLFEYLFVTRYAKVLPVPRVHNSAAHTTRAWTAALRAVPELHSMSDAPALLTCTRS